MTCSYCGNEIHEEGFVEFEGRYFCNALHKYEWETSPGTAPQREFVPQPMVLGDMFDVTFKLTGRVLLRALALVFIIVSPAAVLFTFAAHDFYSTIGAQISAEQGANISGIASIVFKIVLFMFSLLLLVVSGEIAKFAVTTVSCADFAGERPTVTEVLREVFSFRLWSVFAQYLIQIFTFIGIGLVAVVMVFVMASGKDLVAMLLAMLMLVPCFCAILYLVIRWSFAIPAIAYENAYAIESLKRSTELVAGSWWRTFGIIVLFGILAILAVTLIATPIAFATMWDFYKDYVGLLASSTQDVTDPTATASLMRSAGRGIGINMALNIGFSAVLTPIYLTVLYFDLAARDREEKSLLHSPDSLFSGLQRDIGTQA